MAVLIKKRNPLGELNLTPMIDMVFLLLIFFLVAGELAEEEEQALDIKVPVASQAMPLTARPKELVVHISRDGRFMMSGQILSEQQLGAALQQAAASNPGRQTMIIRADGRATAQAIVTVVSLCNQAGIRDHRLKTVEPGS
jgi:biopolymer transport protein ExbD